MSFEGVIKILPGANVTSTLEEAQGAVAQQVMRKAFQNQVSHWAGLQSSATSTTLFNALFYLLVLFKKHIWYVYFLAVNLFVHGFITIGVVCVVFYACLLLCVVTLMSHSLVTQVNEISKVKLMCWILYSQ